VIWTEGTLGNLFDLYQPQTITTKDLIEDGEYQVYGANGVIGRYDKFNHEEPQLLVTCRGATCGAVNVSSPFAWINGNAMVVKPKKNDIDIKFVEYFFRGAVDLSKAITGAAQPQITRQSLSPIKFSYPLLATQQKIVERLDAIFAEIDKAKAAAEANVKNAKALFQSYLTEVFERGGEGWKKDTLTNICKVTTGKWDANHAVENGAYRFYTCASKFLYCDTKKYDGKNIILPGNGANVGELYFYDGAFDAYQRTYVLSEIKTIPEYMFYHLKSNWEETNRFKQYGSATNFLKIGNFKDYIVRYPAMEEQKNIVTKLDAISEEVKKSTKSYTNKVSELSKLKQSILQQAFNGELVKE
jgi:type I restriction enzyme S subunit